MFNFGKSKENENSPAKEQKPKVEHSPKPKQQVAVKKQPTTISKTKNNNMSNNIGKETEFEGNIKSKGQLQIHGLVKGTISAEDKLVLGETGKVEGDIFCKDIELAGEVNGNVKAKGKVTIKPKAFIKGDVRYYDIEIESGAHIACTISRMNPENENSASAKPNQTNAPATKSENNASTIAQLNDKQSKEEVAKISNGQLKVEANKQ